VQTSCDTCGKKRHPRTGDLVSAPIAATSYEEIHNRAAQQELTEEFLCHYIRQIKYHPRYRRIAEAKAISMLHEEVLALLYYFVVGSQAAVVEIGAYVGGSTVILAEAAKDFRKDPILSIEVGGRHDHPDIPSDDIFEDLRKNVEHFGMSDHVRLLKGWSNDPDICGTVKSAVAPLGIGVLIIDADGNVDRDLKLYAEVLNDKAILILDDYCTPSAKEKETLVRKWVDQAESDGSVISLGVWGWGTWIGLHRKRR